MVRWRNHMTNLEARRISAYVRVSRKGRFVQNNGTDELNNSLDEAQQGRVCLPAAIRADFHASKRSVEHQMGEAHAKGGGREEAVEGHEAR